MYGATNRIRMTSRGDQRPPPAHRGAKLDARLSAIAVQLLETAGDIDETRHGCHRRPVGLSVVAQPRFDKERQREVADLSAALALVVDHFDRGQCVDAPSSGSGAVAPIELFRIEKELFVERSDLRDGLFA